VRRLKNWNLDNACATNLIVSEVVRREIDSKLREIASKIIEKATELKKNCVLWTVCKF
jgi:hypothetical protein